MSDLMTPEQARRIYPCDEREEIINLCGDIALLRYPDPATLSNPPTPYEEMPSIIEFTGKNTDKDRLLEILMEAWERSESELATLRTALGEAQARAEAAEKLLKDWRQTDIAVTEAEDEYRSHQDWYAVFARREAQQRKAAAEKAIHLAAIAPQGETK